MPTATSLRLEESVGKSCECGLAADRVPEEGTGPVPEHSPPSLKVSPGGWWRGSPGGGSRRLCRWGLEQEERELQGCFSHDPGAEGVGVSGLHTWMPSSWRTRPPLSGLWDWGGRTGWSSPRRQGLVQTPDFRIRIAGTSPWLLPGFFHRAGSASWVRPEPVVRLGGPCLP